MKKERQDKRRTTSSNGLPVRTGVKAGMTKADLISAVAGASGATN